MEVELIVTLLLLDTCRHKFSLNAVAGTSIDFFASIYLPIYTPLYFLHKAVETNIKRGPFMEELKERIIEGKTARNVEHRTTGY